MLYHNETITIHRGPKYATTITTGLKVHIYEQTDDYNVINSIDWWQDTLKMMTKYAWILTGDRITTSQSIIYIVKKVIDRKSPVGKFYEVIIKTDND